MDIANLGIRIDPSGAVTGAQRVTTALRDMGDAATRETGKIDRGAARAGAALGAMAGNSRRGFLDLTRGLMDAADAAGILNNGFGAMLRRADSAIRAGQQLGAMHRASAMAANGNAAATGTAAAAMGEMGVAAGTAGIGLGAIVGIAAAVLAAIAALVAGFYALAKAIGFVVEGMKLAGPVQQAIQSFTVLTGSATEAARVMEILRKQSVDTGASLTGSMQTVKRFLALGFAPDDAIKLNTSINDVAGSIGMTADEAKLLGMALAQVQAKGVVSMEELRQQIAEKGVPVFEELSKKLGVTGAELNKMVGEGKVAAKELIDIFLNLEGGFAKFAGGAKKMTDTLPGSIAKLSATWDEFLLRLGKPVADAVTPLINKLSGLLTKLLPYADAVGKAIGDAITATAKAIETGQIKELMGLAIAAGIEQGASTLVTVFQLQMIALATTIASTFFSPITTVANFIFDTVATVIDTLTKLLTGDFQGAFAAVGEFFQGLFTGGGGILGVIGASIYNTLGKAFENAVNAFYLGFMKVWGKVAGLISSGLEKIGMDPLSTVEMPGPLNVFDEVEIALPDITGASDKLTGTTARDALKAKLAELAWKPELMGPPKPMEKKLEEIAKPKLDAGGGKGKAEETIKRAEKVETATSRMLDEWGNLAAQLDQGIADLGQSISSNLGNALLGLINGTKSLGQAFSEMASAVIQDILRIVIQMSIQLAMQRALAAAGYSGFAGFQIAHAGGVAGSAAMPKYHAGGRPLSSEANVRVDRGETILTRRRASELAAELRAARGQREPAAPTGQGTATIINVLDRSEITDAVARNPQAVVNAMSRQLPQIRKMILSGQRP